MSRSGQPPGSGYPDPYELQALGDGQPAAQQSGAHLPQPRVAVAEHAPTIVISEPPSSAGARPYRPERQEATLVIRDRRALDKAARRLIAERRGGAPRNRSALWAAFAAIAFTVGSLVAFFSLRSSGSPAPLPVEQSAQTTPKPLSPPVEARKPSTRRVLVTQPTSSQSDGPPKVSLEDLPVERRPRRR